MPQRFRHRKKVRIHAHQQSRGVYVMIEIAVKELKPGMKTAQAIQTPRGQIIVSKDQTLTAATINRIAFYSIPTIFVHEPEAEAPTEPVIPKGNVQEPTYSQRVKQSSEFKQFQLEYAKRMATCKEMFERVQHGDGIEPSTLYHNLRHLMEPVQTTIQLFDMLHNIRQVDDSVYAHCLNVALISFSMGTWLKLPSQDIETLTVAGLLHDIGKTQIPTEILNKPEKYTDEEFALVKSHPRLGYEMLKDLNVDYRIKKVALMHHERCDGTGYPAGITQEYIDDFALIVAIADVYDAMTAARTYRQPLCAFQVIDSFEKEGLHKYKPRYILTFLKRIVNAYQSNRVMLSNGKSGNIVFINDKALAKPIVELSDGTFIDLSKEHDVSIVATL